MRTESLIRAKFTGKDGSQGYRKGEKYTLLAWMQKQSLFGPSYIFVKRPGIDSSQCPYLTIRLFLSNWEIIND